jgi:hypothetical protein
MFVALAMQGRLLLTQTFRLFTHLSPQRFEILASLAGVGVQFAEMFAKLLACLR